MHSQVLALIRTEYGYEESMIQRMMEPYCQEHRVPSHVIFDKKAFFERRLAQLLETNSLTLEGARAYAEKATDDEIKMYLNEEDCWYDYKNGYVWSTYNNKSKWDWWVIGGRYEGTLPLRNGEYTDSCFLEELNLSSDGINKLFFDHRSSHQAFLYRGIWFDNETMGPDWQKSAIQILKKENPEWHVYTLDCHC